jgi:maleate cis-trans isomerase
MNATEVHQRRAEYMEAMINEANTTCNVIENDDELKHDTLKQLAQLAGDNAQQKYEAFVMACNDMKAEPPGPSGGTLVELGGEPV